MNTERHIEIYHVRGAIGDKYIPEGTRTVVVDYDFGKPSRIWGSNVSPGEIRVKGERNEILICNPTLITEDKEKTEKIAKGLRILLRQQET